MYKPHSIQGPVAVAFSGGVDSLYSLLALKDKGMELFALHAQFLPQYLRADDAEEKLGELEKCMASLGVPLHIVDLSAAFDEQVIRPFALAYLAGKTPNPCAFCNPLMKFGLLLDEAERLGASRIATGHYVRLEQMADTPAIFAGDDENKDQSYFLALTPLERLSRAIFPLARLKKTDVAAELARRGVVPPQRSESQEICFISNDDYRAFLRDYTERNALRLPGSGDICLESGHEFELKTQQKKGQKNGQKAGAGPEQKLGEHSGLWNYTQGQRHGLGIAWQEPLYVLDKDIARNRLIVGPKSSLAKIRCHCAAPNFFVPPRQWPAEVWAKTRYRQRLAKARAEFSSDGSLTLHFLADAPQAPSAPGQVAALYAQTEQGLCLLAGAEIL